MSYDYRLYDCVLIEDDVVLMEGISTPREIEVLNRAYEQEGLSRRWHLKEPKDSSKT